MAKNDTILIDGILDDRVAERIPSDRRDEAFEFFAFEQILRDYDLSVEELQSGWVDGENDGGIDGFYILVNGHLLVDPESFMWPKTGCELDVWIVTCKHHETFKQAPLDNLVASLNELLDLSLDSPNLKGAYSDLLLKARSFLLLAYRKTSPRLNRFNIHFAYASRGDSAKVGGSIVARSQQAIDIARTFFGDCSPTFTFLGASELVDLHRRVRAFALELPFLEALSRGERYVLLCQLSAFNSFATDEHNKPRRYLFDSNVRAFMGLNRVNEEIANTLLQRDSPDFWWLNNGVTILATRANVVGKVIQLEAVQIVNGLQTTESIARYFAQGGVDEGQRAVMVKVIVSEDPIVRDAIIRATNNQSAVELASLHATDKIQRDIEDVLLNNGLFYERRSRFYLNQGHSPSVIVAPLYIASGYVSLVLKAPATASKLKSRFMRLDKSYQTVFSETVPLGVWPVIGHILKKTDAVLEKERPIGTAANERFLRNSRQLTALIATSRLLGKFDFTSKELSEIDKNALTEELIKSSWGFIALRIDHPNRLSRKKGGQSFDIGICQDAARIFSLTGVEVIHRSTSSGLSTTRVKQPLEATFIERVNDALPSQPWEPGTHRDVAKSLGANVKDVTDAIQELIATGLRYEQRDGVVYGGDGEVLMIDERRIDRPLEEADPNTN